MNVDVLSVFVGFTALCLVSVVFFYSVRDLQSHQASVDEISSIAVLVASILNEWSDIEKLIKALDSVSFTKAWVAIFDTEKSTVVYQKGREASMATSQAERELLTLLLEEEQKSKLPVTHVVREGNTPNGSLRTIFVAAKRPNNESKLLVCIQSI